MKRLAASLGLACAAWLCVAPANAAITVSFTPSAQHVNVGDAVSVDVGIGGLGAEILSGFDLNFLYSPAILSWSVIDGGGAYGQLGNNWASPPLFVFDSLVNGNLGIQASAFDDDATVAANQADSFVLFHFDLVGAADGVTTFGLGANPDFERNFLGLDFATLGVDVGSACIAVGTGSCDGTNDTPEPASFGLAAVALLAGGIAGRRRRRDRVTA